MHVLYIVVPCYNEEEVLPETSNRLLEKMKSLIEDKILSEKSRIVFVNDGSKDNTWNIIKNLHEKNKIFSGINLSCNRGHQNALLSGLMTVKDLCDITISMDADLQDDIDIIENFIKSYESGSDIVYGVRSERKTDNIFKRATGEGFYKFMKFLGADVVFNHADYRLMSRRALESLSKYKEVNLFLRGIIPMIGYKTDIVYYERHKRFAGESKYPLKKMIAFAFEGITSLSRKPIRFITLLGITILTISFIVSIYFFIQAISGITVSGWASTIISVWFLGGINLFSIGIVGEYVGKIYLETKERPRFIVESSLIKIDEE